MPLLIVEGRKYRLGDLTGEDPLWNVSVDEKTVAPGDDHHRKEAQDINPIGLVKLSPHINAL